MSITPTLSATLTRILQGPSGARTTLAIIVCAFATWFLVALWKHLIFVRNIKEEGKGKTDTGKSQEQQSYEGCFVSLGYHAINTDDDAIHENRMGTRVILLSKVRSLAPRIIRDETYSVQTISLGNLSVSSNRVTIAVMMFLRSQIWDM